MENLELMTIAVDLPQLSTKVGRITNYADAGSSEPKAANVLNATADAGLYVGLLADAQLRIHELLGRHCKNVAQPESTKEKWIMVLRLPPTATALSTQLKAAVESCLAYDIAAHWLTLVKSDRAEELLMLWRNAQQHLKTLSLWQTNPCRITTYTF